MERFEFVPGDEIVIAPGRTLKRIRALVAIAVFGVSAGDLGGYVEKRENLFGNAWVSGDAKVFGNAWVYGDARVYGDAQVYGDARVYGDAQVYGDAKVYGNAWVYGDGSIWWVTKVGRDNGTLTAYMLKDSSIELTRGCFRGSIDEFLSKSEKEHDDDTHIEYRLLIEVAVSRLTRYMAKNPMPQP